MIVGLPAQNMIKKRSIAVCIVLSIVTIGIYGIYWFVCLNNDCNKAANNPNGTSGGVAFLLTIMTCGIYGIYWCYKKGQDIDEASTNRGLTAPNKGVLLLVLCIFGLSIVSYALIQDELNKIADIDAAAGNMQ